MRLKEKILELSSKNKKIKTTEVAAKFNVSRQFASLVIKSLVEEGKLIKAGGTRYAFYVLPKHMSSLGEKVKKRLKNKNLKEHEVLDDIKKQLPFFSKTNENISSIFDYAFSEMLNNAIEHSHSKFIEVEVKKQENTLIFTVSDSGIGAFKSVMEKHKLKSELEAIQDILKGKTTTQPQAHSGEGIFFTSKASDIFVMDSHNLRLRIDNLANDIFIQEIPKKRGTKVKFYVNTSSEKLLNNIFKKYQSSSKALSFDKTEVKIKLYTLGTIYVSRSQARRVLVSLDKFKVIILDFEKVPTVGQAFADEIFRVFAKRHPEIKIKPINMNEAVEFMIKRVGD